MSKIRIDVLRRAMKANGLDPNNQKLVDAIFNALTDDESINQAVTKAAQKTGHQLLEEAYAGGSDKATDSPPSASSQPKRGSELIEEYYRSQKEQNQ